MNDTPKETPDHGPQPPQLDCDAYRDELAGCDLTREEENEVLGVLWHIVCSLVDLGFGLDASQRVISEFVNRAAATEPDQSANPTEPQEGATDE